MTRLHFFDAPFDEDRFAIVDIFHLLGPTGFTIVFYLKKEQLDPVVQSLSDKPDSRPYSLRDID